MVILLVTTVKIKFPLTPATLKTWQTPILPFTPTEYYATYVPNPNYPTSPLAHTITSQLVSRSSTVYRAVFKSQIMSFSFTKAYRFYNALWGPALLMRHIGPCRMFPKPCVENHLWFVRLIQGPFSISPHSFSICLLPVKCAKQIRSCSATLSLKQKNKNPTASPKQDDKKQRGGFEDVPGLRECVRRFLLSGAGGWWGLWNKPGIFQPDCPISPTLPLLRPLPNIGTAFQGKPPTPKCPDQTTSCSTLSSTLLSHHLLAYLLKHF